jgi:hypothetical protein
MKLVGLWAREEQVACYSRKERGDLAWLKAGVWKLEEVMKGLENGRCPLCSTADDHVHTRILLKFPETRN